MMMVRLIVFLCSRNTALQALLVFDILLTDSGFVSPKIELLPRFPQQGERPLFFLQNTSQPPLRLGQCPVVVAGVSQAFAHSLSDNFLGLAEAKGLERALEIFIQATFR